MNSPLNASDTSVVKRARVVLAAIANPKFRHKLTQVLAGTCADTANLPFDWAHGEQIDTKLLRSTLAGLEGLLDEHLITRVERISIVPAREDELQALSAQLITTVFSRIAPRTKLSETELNAALAMFVSDVANVRRAAVDAGILQRTPDGREYYLAL
ncbi:hypothetical protein J2S49_001511 [Arcanobacterium wilhelmae]|uniref:DUF2087 domain-containing protein n=1 Tax=Arcanobacterium wilhelmae TaxID=1803177 RepID=A0ABT9ND41_9ACTO|nr:DUF2087 domain-containing protein [Arcanobacterium wilhelmae]MDP9801435.1 hypothetical protein [Arcanobacterium wilhelmae]WFN90770.1 DUF2087 domain-containing protein [Arcanobacterium wilhelmae]